MGSGGYAAARWLDYQPGEVILEVGADRDEGSTPWLAQFGASVGVSVVVVDVDQAACDRINDLFNVRAICGLAEQVLQDWAQPIRFAWLDGHDWPYEGPEYPPGCWDNQRDEYLARGQEYSQAASQASHLRIAELIADRVVLGGVVAFDDTWWLGQDWDGKGGTAVPYLLNRGFEAATVPVDQLVLLRRMQ